MPAAGTCAGAEQPAVQPNADCRREGLPIEALQSLQAWAQARREVIQALADYNAAQLALFRALGWPVAR